MFNQVTKRYAADIAGLVTKVPAAERHLSAPTCQPERRKMSGRNEISERRINKLRELIAAAERDGVGAKKMVLRLTLGDAAELKRDRSVATHEISFSKGEMRFLGVKVVEGGISVSSLDRTAA